MRVATLSLTNFRNITSLELELPPGLVLLVGGNAQGKSNLLEAVYLLSIAKSYRASAERDMVSWLPGLPCGMALVSAKVLRRDGELDVVLGLEPYQQAAKPGGQAARPGGAEATVRKHIRVNGVARRASELVGMLNAVLFTADDIEMVSGPPALRRRYLDVMLSQVSRGYVRALQRYQRVLVQRNHLLRRLRDGQAQEGEMASWDRAFCAEGAAVLEARYGALAELTVLVQEAYEQLMGPGGSLGAEYVATAPCEPGSTLEAIRGALAEAVERSRRQERALAQTVVGPHRDDLRLTVDGVEMARHASRGQARLAALAMRLAEGRFLTARRGEPPVLLLDDVLSELDERRRTLVLEAALAYPQALVTTADLTLVPPACRDAATVLWVAEGRVSTHPPEGTPA